MALAGRCVPWKRLAGVPSLAKNRGADVKSELTALGVGEAFVSVLGDAGIPTNVERVTIIPPSGQVGTISDTERRAVIDASPLRKRYGAELPEAQAYTNSTIAYAGKRHR